MTPPAWPTVRLLSDAPLEAFEPGHPDFDPADAARCGPVAGQVARHLADFIRHRHGRHDSIQLTAPRIGVFGGLGQGKTTVIRWALWNLEKELAYRHIRKCWASIFMMRMAIGICGKPPLPYGHRNIGFVEGYKQASQRKKRPPFDTQAEARAWLLRIVRDGAGRIRTLAANKKSQAERRPIRKNHGSGKPHRTLRNVYIMLCRLGREFSLWTGTAKVEWFDAAHYKSDDLEYELDRLLGGIGPATAWAIARLLLVYFIPLVGLVLLACSMPKEWIAEIKPWLPLLGISGLVGAFIASFMKPLGYWWRSGQRNMNLGSAAWLRQGWKLLARRVEILVIDDLDRASLAQQRAVLRALYKHQARLGFAVVVGFDESRLLDAKPDPETPVELLRKAIHVKARMPVRVASDTLRLAWTASAQAARLNPALGAVLADVRSIAALARVVELLVPLQPVSPRAVKHVLNNSLFALAQVKSGAAPGVEDWRAVLRLAGLYQCVPELRQQGEALRSALQENQPQGLEAVLAASQDELPALRRQAAARLFDATRAYRPADLDWSPWVVLWAARSLGLLETAATAADDGDGDGEVPSFETVNWLADGLERLAQGWPHDALANISTLLMGLPAQSRQSRVEPVAALALRALLAVLLARWEPGRRWRVLSALWLATDQGLLGWAVPEAGQGEWRVALAEWAWADAELWPLLKRAGFEAWWGRLADPALAVPPSSLARVLSLLPASQFKLLDGLAWATQSGRAGQQDFGLEYWLASYAGLPAGAPCLDELSRLALPGAPVGAAAPKRLWPPLSVETRDFPAVLQEHCTAWRKLRMAAGVASTPLEHCLFVEEGFGRWLADWRNDPHSLLPAFAELFREAETGLWSARTWLDMLNPRIRTAKKPLPQWRILRLRFDRLWQDPASGEDARNSQFVLACCFASRKALGRLALALDAPLSSPSLVAALVDSLRFWAELRAERLWKPDRRGFNSLAEYGEWFCLLQVASLPAEFRHKVLPPGLRHKLPAGEGDFVLPEAWRFDDD